MNSFININSGAFFKSLTKYGINTPLRIAHFFGQLSVESANFTANVEKISVAKAQEKYQNHRYLGNKLPGDGYRFRGRGLVQLTGRANYESYKKYSGVDIVSKPELASELSTSIDIACWYWKTRNINASADKDSVKLVTKKINGGDNGLAERVKTTSFFKTQNITLDLLKKKVQLFRVKRISWNIFNSTNNRIFFNQ